MSEDAGSLGLARFILGRLAAVVFAVPIYDDNPVRRAPLVTYALIGACTGAWLWQIAVGEELTAFHYGMIPAALFGYWPPGVQPIPPWATLFTSMFLHGGWMHLISNMLFLWIFGNNIEDLLGKFRYLLLYLASGVTAALIQGLSAPTSQIPMVGASGAVAGVLGAYLLTYPRANVHVLVWIVLLLHDRYGTGLGAARVLVRDAGAERVGHDGERAGRCVLGACRRLCRGRRAVFDAAPEGGGGIAAAAHPDLGERAAGGDAQGDDRPPQVSPRQCARRRTPPVAACVPGNSNLARSTKEPDDRFTC